MDAAWKTASDSRGSSLLLEHCASLERGDEPRPSAFDRLQQAIGDRLARLLVSALSGDHRRSSRGLAG